MRSIVVACCYLLAVMIGTMVVFELVRFNFYAALMWMLIAAAYLLGLMALIDHIEAREERAHD